MGLVVGLGMGSGVGVVLGYLPDETPHAAGARASIFHGRTVQHNLVKKGGRGCDEIVVG